MTTTKRAAIYCRISRKRPGEASASTDRQAEGCRKLCEAKGWKVAEVYTDKNTSAFSGEDADRPALDRLLDDVKRGAVDVVVIYKLDRLFRNVRHCVDMVDFLSANGATLASLHDPVDTSTDAGKAIVTVLSVFAELESANIRRRIRSRQQQRGEEGIPHAAGKRGYGYTWPCGCLDAGKDHDDESCPNADTIQIVPSEADILREVATRIIEGGQSVRSIVLDLNNREVPTITGAPWSASTLVNSLRREALAGIHSYNVWSEDVNAEPERVTESAKWEPIFTRARWSELVAMLEPGSVKPRAKDAYLLTGFIKCGECGSPMYHNARKSKTRTQHRYVCVPGKGGSCGAMTSAMESTNDVVRDAVLIHWAKSNAEERSKATKDVPDPLTLEKDILAAEARLDDLVKAFYVDGEMPESIYREQSNALRDKIADLKDQTIGLYPPALAEGLASNITNPDELLPVWEGLTVQSQRGILFDFVERVDIAPSTKRGPVFDTDRVTVSFH